MTAISEKFRQFMRVCVKSIKNQLIILTEPENPLNISLSLSMAFAAETHGAGQF